MKKSNQFSGRVRFLALLWGANTEKYFNKV